MKLHRYIVIASLCLYFNVSTVAQQNDSIIELQEFVVQAQSQRVKAGGMMVTPTEVQKKSSPDGFALLSNVGIPQISVFPSSTNVTTVFGGDVALFINKAPATADDVKALKVADITAINYYEYPSDPHYGGASHVIDFVVKEAGGGYTLFTLNTNVYGNKYVIPAAYSKYTYRHLTFDVLFCPKYENFHHGDGGKSERYSLLTPSGEIKDIYRETGVDMYRNRLWSIPVALGFTYKKNSLVAKNTVGFLYDNIPDNTTAGLLSISSRSDADYHYTRSNNSISRTVYWNGFYYFPFSNKVDLTIKGWLVYVYLHGNNDYYTNIKDAQTITQISRDKSLDGYLKMSMRYKHTDVSNWSLNYLIRDVYHDVDYAGSSISYNNYNDFQMQANLSYELNLDAGLKLHAEAGGSWNKYKANQTYTYNFAPTGLINLSYAPNNQHQVNLTASFEQKKIPEAYKTSSVLPENEFMYITGNPDLKRTSVMKIQANYIWIPSNVWTVMPFADYERYYNAPMLVYSRYQDGSALLRSYIDKGFFATFDTGIKAVYKPLSNLSFQAEVVYVNMRRTGAVNRALNSVNSSLQIRYSIKNFYMGSGVFPYYKLLNSIDGGVTTNPLVYTLYAGWSNGKVDLTIFTNNIFDKNWHTNTTTYNSPLYSSKSSFYSDYRRGINIAVSYVLNYGKKIKRDDELRIEPTSGSSAILK